MKKMNKDLYSLLVIRKIKNENLSVHPMGKK